MRAYSLDFNAEFVTRRHDRTFGHAEVARRHTWPIMDAEHCIYRKLDEQTIVDHCLCAGAALFGGLENEHDRAVKFAVFCQMPRCAEEHRGMPIVAACVHLSVVLRAMIEAIQFLNRQGVHVSAESNRARTFAALQYTDDACLAQSTVSFDAPELKVPRNQICCCCLFITQFRVGMDRSSKGLDFAVSGLNFRDQFHDEVMLRLCFGLRGIARGYMARAR